MSEPYVINISSDDDDDDEVQVLEFHKQTQQLLSQAPPKVVKKLSEAECPICFDTLTEATATFCGHVYCLNCLQRSVSLSSARGQTSGRKGVGLCPLCRKTVAFKDGLVLRLRTGRKVEPPSDPHLSGESEEEAQEAGSPDSGDELDHLFFE